MLAATFHAQQAAEKYIKTVLVWHQVEFPKTHDLDHLIALVNRADGKLTERVREASALTPYGVDGRYPGDLPEPSPAEAKDAVEIAERVRDEVHYFNAERPSPPPTSRRGSRPLRPR